MPTLPPQQLEALIERCLEDFYQRRFRKLEKLKLRQILRRKNPYLFKALGTEQAAEIVSRILEAYISSSDETIFGEAYFEQIASNLPGIQVSAAKGVDLEVHGANEIHAYALKSGPNPFNSSAKVRQDTEFKELKSRLMKLRKQFDPVLAYAYGRKNKASSGKYIYRESSGEVFWTELTGDSTFYLKLITLMRDVPLRRKEEYQRTWDAAINRFAREFTEDFCSDNGRIDWEKLTKYVSGKDKLQLP